MCLIRETFKICSVEGSPGPGLGTTALEDRNGHYPPVSQTRLKPSPRLKSKSELFQLKETCSD